MNEKNTRKEIIQEQAPTVLMIIAGTLIYNINFGWFWSPLAVILHLGAILVAWFLFIYAIIHCCIFAGPRIQEMREKEIEKGKIEKEELEDWGKTYENKRKDLLKKLNK